MDDILVSIVIPVYNSEKTIGKCLDSLITQTYKNIEIICTNDYSKDRSLDVLNKYAQRDSRIIVIDHKENKNAGGARNTCIRAAQGHYVCLVDNDDWLAENAIEKMIDVSNHGEKDMVTSDWTIYYSREKQVLRKNLTKGLDYNGLIKFGCLKDFGILGCLWKRSIFINNNLFYPEKVFYEDNAIAYTLMAYAYSFSYVEEPLYYYVISNTSVTGFTTQRKITDRTTTTEMYLEMLQKHGFYNDYKSLWDFFCLKMCITTMFMLTHFPHSLVKEDFYRNIKLIHHCFPNKYVLLLRKRALFALFPIMTYWLNRFIKKYKKI